MATDPPEFELREVASGLGMTEGPLWLDQHRVAVCSVSRGHLVEIDLRSGETRELAETGGNPTGLTRDGAGAIWIAQGGNHMRTRSKRPTGPGIQRLGHEGEAKVEDLLTEGLVAPNDCVFDPEGRLWFTDPSGTPFDAEGPPGRVWVFEPEVGLKQAADYLHYPNGIAFSEDPTRLYVTETATARVLRFEVEGNEMRLLGVAAELEQGHPDGMTVDHRGRLYVAGTTSDAVQVFAPDGGLLDRIELEPESFPTNVAFGGPGGRTLIITTIKGGKVFAAEPVC